MFDLLLRQRALELLVQLRWCVTCYVEVSRDFRIAFPTVIINKVPQIAQLPCQEKSPKRSC